MTRLKRMVYTVCALLMLFALWNQHRLNQSEADAQALQEELSAIAHPSPSPSPSPTPAPTAAAEIVRSEDVSAGRGLAVLNPWIDELYARNEDLIGWLTVPNTCIDYPVVQTTEDRDYYLNHNFDGMNDPHGTLYADVACWIGDGNNLIIYGHHMADGTMFKGLTRYQTADFCRTNGDVVFYTRDCTRYFRPVAVMRISVKEARQFPYHTVTALANSAEYDAYIDGCRPYADWMTDVLPTYPAMLLTLSTCEYSKKNSRLVVVCACTGMDTASDLTGAQTKP